MREEVRQCLVAVDVSKETLRARFRFAPDLTVFAGHFPGRPIVPGVYLIETARILCERAIGKGLRIACIADAKFTTEVGPGESIDIEAKLTEETEGWDCRATILSEKGQAARIQLRLREERAS